MMLEYSFKKSNLAFRIKNAVDEALDAGIITPDFKKDASTQMITDTIVGRLNHGKSI